MHKKIRKIAFQWDVQVDATAKIARVEWDRDRKWDKETLQEIRIRQFYGRGSTDIHGGQLLIIIICKLENIISPDFSSDVYEQISSSLALLSGFSSLYEEASVTLSSLTTSSMPCFLAYFQSKSSQPELWTFITFRLIWLPPSKVKLLLDSFLVTPLGNCSLAQLLQSISRNVILQTIFFINCFHFSRYCPLLTPNQRMCFFFTD